MRYMQSINAGYTPCVLAWETTTQYVSLCGDRVWDKSWKIAILEEMPETGMEMARLPTNKITSVHNSTLFCRRCRALLDVMAQARQEGVATDGWQEELASRLFAEE